MKEFSSKKQPSKLNAIDSKFLERSTKAQWERSSRMVSGRKQELNGIVFIDANIVPSDVLKDIDDATGTKIGFNYTGPDPLDHPDEADLVERVLRNSKEAYGFLPVLLSLGQSCVLPKITPDLLQGNKLGLKSYLSIRVDNLNSFESVLSGLDDVLKQKRDKREGQRILTYDLMFLALKAAIAQYNLPVPLVFQSSHIDRTSMTYFNTCEEV